MSRDLTALFEPATVALVGASNDPMKWGGWCARSLIEGRDAARRTPPRVLFVNRRSEPVLGEPAYPSLALLPAPPDLVLLAVPATVVEQAVEDALDAGARAIVVIAAGFGEASEDGARLQRRLVRRVRDGGAVLLGPNCLGVADTSHGLNASSFEFTAGPVSVISQSGNLAVEVGMLLDDAGLGIARFASVGNQAHIGVADLLGALPDHDPTRVVAIYLEDPIDGERLVAAFRRLAEAGKPPLVLKAGRTTAGANAAHSHTGALAGDARVFDAALRDAGGIAVQSPDEIVECAKALLGGVRMRGRRIAIVADGGGHGVVCSDLLTDHGFSVATLGERTAARLEPLLPHARPVNPVDLAGAGESDVNSFWRTTEALMEDDAVDAVLFSGSFGAYASLSNGARRVELEASRRLAELRDRHAKPLLVHSMMVARAMPAIRDLRDRQVPTYTRIADAIRGLEAVVIRDPAPLADAAPTPHTPVGTAPTYPAARALLSELGVRFPDGELAVDDADAARIATRIGCPVVLKAVAANLLHKSDSGGVLVGVETPAAAASGARTIRQRVGIPLDGVFVERMAPTDGVELVVGARRDALFGPIVLVGVGGIFVETLNDVMIALAPADPDHIAALLRQLRAWPVLAGTRGAAAVDTAAVARVAARLGDLLVNRADISEAEINPLRATRDGVIALDARIVGTQNDGIPVEIDAVAVRGAPRSGAH
jgi:acyl-CoA synthetase (NDP forming)